MTKAQKGKRTALVAGSPSAIDSSAIAKRILSINGSRVILDADLADFYQTTTSAINQYRARNQERFSPDYAFQLTDEEWEDLRSQDVISTAHGGRRFRPWAYTEHGVAMMSMGMKSERAVGLSKAIIGVFVQYRRGSLTSERVVTGPRANQHRREMAEQIYDSMKQLMKFKVTSDETLGEALGGVATRSLGSIKALLEAPGLKNERLSAETAKILAETEKLYAETRRTHEETNSLSLKNKREALALVRELREMAAQLERDDWVELLGDSFGPTKARRLPKPSDG